MNNSNKLIDKILQENEHVELVELTEDEMRDIAGAGSITGSCGSTHDKARDHSKSHDKCGGSISW